MSSVPFVVSYSYDPTAFDLASVGLDPTNTTLYAWHAGRLTNVTWQTGHADYQYLTGADLVERLTFSKGEALTIRRAYDAADRLLSISATNNLTTINSFSYTLDATGRRTARQDADGARTDWGYDAFDQLTSAARTNSPNGAADAAYHFQYQYDQVGNRLHEDRGRQDLGGTFNNLNQLTHLTYGGQLNIIGSVSTTDAYVLVQGITNAPPFYNATNW